MRKFSRDSPSRKSPAIASRGAKPMEWTRPSRPPQRSLSAAEGRVDLAVVGDVHVVDRVGAEFGGDLGDALPEAFADVREGEFGAFALARLRDAVGNRAVGQHTGDQQPLALQKTHGRCRLRSEGGATTEATKATEQRRASIGGRAAALAQRAVETRTGAERLRAGRSWPLTSWRAWPEP